MLVLEVFIDPSKVGVMPQMFLMYVYGYILYTASETLSNGSEMLLCLFGPGLIGGLIIPILGAVPDSAIILMSGLGTGSKKQIQHELSVGVGTLAGSTIMLLTIPWAAAIYLGRRDIDETTGEAKKVMRGDKKVSVVSEWGPGSWSNQGVTTFKYVPTLVKIMVGTSLSYFIIQIPALFFLSHPTLGEKAEHYFAGIGLVVCVMCFIAYSIYQIQNAAEDEATKSAQRQASRNVWKKSLSQHFGDMFNDRIARIFHKHDLDHNGLLDRSELTNALRELGLKADRKEVTEILAAMDGAGGDVVDEMVSLSEFSYVIRDWMHTHGADSKDGDLRIHHGSLPPADDAEDDGKADDESVGAALLPSNRPVDAHIVINSTADAERVVLVEDADDVEEEEEEYTDLTDAELMMKAVSLLVMGTLMVTVFSDPMVDVIVEFSKHIHVEPFYVSFIVTPLVSNASEIIACLYFAKKRTASSISLALSSLYGAATMNNTLGISVLLALIFFRHLSWEYSAEVLSTLLVTYIVAYFGLNRTLRMYQAAIVFTLFPISLVLIAVLNHVGVR